MDTLTPAQRSERMSLVRSKNTMPEMLIRRLVHRMGFRYRLHVRDLPGNPDLVFPSRGKIIFIH
jgi:DNA mismatch endonuclease (patch repair protein)